MCLHESKSVLLTSVYMWCTHYWSFPIPSFSDSEMAYGIMLAERFAQILDIESYPWMGWFCFIFLMSVGFGMGINWYSPDLMILIIFSWICLIINYSIEKLEFGFQWLQGWKQNYDSNCKVLACFIALLSTITVISRLKSQPVFHWKSNWGICFPKQVDVQGMQPKAIWCLCTISLSFIFQVSVYFSFVLKLLDSHMFSILT